MREEYGEKRGERMSEGGEGREERKKDRISEGRGEAGRNDRVREGEGGEERKERVREAAIMFFYFLFLGFMQE